ncbi:hypothetical protein McanCB56680_001430 [Microsporum canis]
MPTHSDIRPHLPVPAASNATTPPTCPPETDRITSWIESAEGRIDAAADNGLSSAQHSLARESLASGSATTTEALPPHQSQGSATDDDTTATQPLGRETTVAGSAVRPGVQPLAPAEEVRSPISDSTATDDYETDEPMTPSTSVSVATEIKDEQREPPPAAAAHLDTLATHRTSMGFEYSEARLVPDHSSSYFRGGSRFIGTQQSDQQIYTVDVEIKNVDMTESYLCGYLKIKGLTPDHPTLTTFFEGEIIGTKHTFQTRHEDWGATEKTDMHHWSRFPAWRPLAKLAKKPDFTYKDYAQRENIFMRWKEAFLVPDHRVKTISGASFEGFYYICFNQVQGTISGIYFHAKSEK